MASDVTVTITSDSVGVQRASFGKALILGYNAPAGFTERTRTYSSLAELDDDFASTTVEYKCASQLFAQEPAPAEIMIGRGTLPPTLVYTMSLVTAAAGRVYALHVEGEGVTATDISYTALADITVSGVTNGSDLFTAVAHGMATGDGPYRLTNSGGGLPAGSAVDTNYWIIRLSADTFSIATSYADAIALTAVNLTTDGTGVHTLQRDANDVIVAILVDRLNSVVGNNFIAAQVAGAGDTDSWTVTADAAGDWFSIAVADPTSIKSAMTHADPGVATDLAAILTEDDSWYTLLTNYNSNAYVLAAAGWVETAGLKTYAVDVAETDAENTAVLNSDTLDDLHTLNRARTAGFYHRNPQEFLAASAMGKFLPYDPGEATLKFKSLSGVTAPSYTTTQTGRLEARQANYYRSKRGVSQVVNGHTAGGSLPNFFDVRRDVDWLHDDMEAGVFAVLSEAAKVPFTDEGISIVLKEIRASLDRAVRFGVIVAGYRLTAPLAADVSSANKLLRILPDIKWTATLAGAVHSVTISGVVSV